MSFRVSIFVATASVAMLSPVLGCSEPGAPGPGAIGGRAGESSGGLGGGSSGQNNGGSSGGGSSGQGSGGLGSGGGSAGSNASGSGGMNVAGSGGGTAGPAPTFETVKYVFQNINPPCAASDCHGSGGHEERLTLVVNDSLYMRLTTHISVNCGNIPVVNPSKPAESALIKLLKGPCGITPRMPNGCTEQDGNCVPNEYIAAIEQWVANGAPPQ